MEDITTGSPHHGRNKGSLTQTHHGRIIEDIIADESNALRVGLIIVES